jgi:hypothetical protein
MERERLQRKVFFTGKDLENMGLISEGTLRNQRVRAKRGDKKGVLPFVMVGRSVRYRKDDIIKFVRDNSVRP